MEELLADALARREQQQAAMKKAAPVVALLSLIVLALVAWASWSFADWFTPRAISAVAATNQVVQSVNSTLTAVNETVNDAPSAP